MCGIMISKTAYRQQMSHRGIKTHVTSYSGLILVHEHLPIQTRLWNNPIIETRNHIILFNGELFDIPKEFDNDLDYIKSIWKDDSWDSTDQINRIFNTDGFYSFILYNKISKEIIVFTDPLGKKQLYYSDQGIASEIRGLYDSSMTEDKLFIAHTIKFGYVTNDRTPYNEIKRLLPNKIYKFDKSLNLISASKSIYPIEPNKDINLFNPGYRSEILREIIEQAVKNRLVGHEKIGLLLSGGLDSSIIYYHIKKLGYEVTTYCVDNEEDLKYAKMLDPNVITIDKWLINVSHKKALIAMEMPVDLGSMNAQFALFSKVKETVILTGDGADEIFGGYKRMNQYDSQYSDIFDELPFYHNIRLDRMSMWYTKEVRSPFMALDIVRYAMGLSYNDRIDKVALRRAYIGILPSSIVGRPKEPLKSDNIRKTDPIKYRSNLIKQFEELK